MLVPVTTGYGSLSGSRCHAQQTVDGPGNAPAVSMIVGLEIAATFLDSFRKLFNAQTLVVHVAVSDAEKGSSSGL